MEEYDSENGTLRASVIVVVQLHLSPAAIFRVVTTALTKMTTATKGTAAPPMNTPIDLCLHIQQAPTNNRTPGRKGGTPAGGKDAQVAGKRRSRGVRRQIC